MTAPALAGSATPGRGPGRRSARAAILGLVLAAIALALFAPVLGFGFVLLDDDLNVYANPLVHPGVAQDDGRFERIWREPYLQMYIPVTYSAWALVAQAAERPLAEGEAAEAAGAANGLAPRPFHALNVALHAFSILCVFAILRAALADDVGAAFGALFFAVHPLQVEPVAWVSGWKDVGSGSLALASLWLYAVHARSRGTRSALSWALALAAFALAVLAKPSAVVVPLLAAVLDVGCLRRSWRSAAASLWPFGLLGLVGIALTLGVQPPDADVPAIALGARPLVALDALGFYLGKLVLPLELAPLYDRRPDAVLARGSWWIGAFALAAVLAAALAALVKRPRSPVPLAGLALFALGFAPVLGLVPFTFQVISTVADRYAYLPLLGAALFFGWIARSGRTAALLSAVAVLAMGLRARDQLRHWRASEPLFVHALAVNPSSGFAHTNLGEIYAREGRVDEALGHFEEAVRLDPGSARARNNLGSYLGENGRLEEALEHLEEAVRLDPGYSRARMGLASALIGLGRYPEAIRELEAVHRLEPEFAGAYQSRGMLLAALGDARGALEALEEALRLDPELVAARVQLGSLYLAGGRVPEAVVALQTAVGRSPEHARARAELGRALLRAERPREAAAELERALELDGRLAEVRPLLERARAAAAEPPR
jgi:tetratricopeptide (TPR) repeat protein